VPYVKVEGDRHLPLFYFEGDTAPLSAEAVTLQGWQLARLRFLPSVQGVRFELVQGGDLAWVVGLPAVLAGYPAAATTEKFWLESDLLAQGRAAERRGRTARPTPPGSACSIMCFKTLRCTALHCNALPCGTALRCTALHCTALRCTALHTTHYTVCSTHYVHLILLYFPYPT
jgi:hypothetical protein